MAAQTTITIEGRAILRIGDLDGLLLALEPMLSDDAGHITLDLSGLTFIGPTCLALVVAACCHAGVVHEVIPPSSPALRAYLERMDVFALMPCDAPAGAGLGRRDPVGFRECRRFGTVDECVEAARELVGAVDERCELSGSSRNALMSCVAELAENVVFHADSGQGGFAAAQSWPKKKTIEVGIVDLGRGIRRSLADNPDNADHASDVDAIRSAMLLGVTATPERNTGQGLYSAARLLEDNGGRILVRSGAGYVYDGALQRDGAAHRMPGTLVGLTIRTDRPLDAARVAHMIGSLKGGNEDSDDLFD